MYVYLIHFTFSPEHGVSDPFSEGSTIDFPGVACLVQGLRTPGSIKGPVNIKCKINQGLLTRGV